MRSLERLDRWAWRLLVAVGLGTMALKLGLVLWWWWWRP